jgi:histone H3/H4
MHDGHDGPDGAGDGMRWPLAVLGAIDEILDGHRHDIMALAIKRAAEDGRDRVEEEDVLHAYLVLVLALADTIPGDFP